MKYSLLSELFPEKLFLNKSFKISILFPSSEEYSFNNCFLCYYIF